MKTFNKVIAAIMSVSMLMTSGGFVRAAEIDAQSGVVVPAVTKLDYTEDYSVYNETNARIGMANAVVGLSQAGNFASQVFAENETGTWELSGIDCGADFDTGNGVYKRGKGWIAPDSNGDPEMVKVLGQWNYGTTGLFNLKNVELKKLNSLEIRLQGEAASTGVRFMVSEDEKTYYQIGHGNFINMPGGTANTDTQGMHFIKVVNGAAVAAVPCEAGTWTHGTAVPTMFYATIDYATNTISFKATTTDGGTTSLFEGSYVDTELTNVAAAAKYPVAVYAGNDGTTKVHQFKFNADVQEKVAEADKYTYYDILDDVTIGEGDYALNEGEAIGTVGAVAERGNPKKLFSSNGADYILSGVDTGRSVDGYPGNGAYDVVNGAVRVKDTHVRITAAVVDLGEKEYTDFTGFTASTVKSSGHDIAHEMRFMVSADEKSYYALGITRCGYTDGVMTAFANPYFKKVVNGTAVDISPDDDATAAIKSSYHLSSAQATGAKKYDISIDGNTINFEFNFAGYAFAGSYEDANLASMITGTRYPFALTALGDGWVAWDKLGVAYEEDVPNVVVPSEWTTVYEEDFQDLITGTYTAKTSYTDLAFEKADGSINDDWAATGSYIDWGGDYENWTAAYVKDLNGNKYVARTKVGANGTNPVMVQYNGIKIPANFSVSADFGRNHGADGATTFARFAQNGNSYYEVGFTPSGKKGYNYFQNAASGLLTYDPQLTFEEGTSEEDKTAAITAAVKTYYSGKPYLLKVVNGTPAELVMGEALGGLESNLDTRGKNIANAAHIDAIVNNGKMSYTLTVGGTEVLSGTDIDTPWIAKNNLLTFGGGGEGDGATAFDNIVIYANAEDVVETIEIPADWSAYYDEDFNDFTKAQYNEGTTNAEITYAKDDGTTDKVWQPGGSTNATGAHWQAVNVLESGSNKWLKRGLVGAWGLNYMTMTMPEYEPLPAEFAYSVDLSRYADRGSETTQSPTVYTRFANTGSSFFEMGISYGSSDAVFKGFAAPFMTWEATDADLTADDLAAIDALETDDEKAAKKAELLAAKKVVYYRNRPYLRRVVDGVTTDVVIGEKIENYKDTCSGGSGTFKFNVSAIIKDGKLNYVASLANVPLLEGRGMDASFVEDGTNVIIGSQGVGESGYAFDNVKIMTDMSAITPVTPPVFAEDFSAYNDTNAVTQDITSLAQNYGHNGAWATTVKGWRITRGKTDIGRNTTPEGHEYKWVSSDGVWTAVGCGRDHSYAYMNTSTKRIVVAGSGQEYGGMTLMDTDMFSRIDKITVSTTSASQGSTIALFVSEDEKNFLAFDTAGEQRPTAENAPIVRKYVDKSATNLAKVDSTGTEYVLADDCIAETTGVWRDGVQDVEWTFIMNADGSLSWEATSASKGQTAKGVIPASVVAEFADNAKFPIGFMSKGDNAGSFDNLKVYGELNAVAADKPAYETDFSYYTNDTIDNNEYKNAVTQDDGVKDGVFEINTSTGAVTSTRDFTGWRTADGAKALNTAPITMLDTEVGPEWITSTKFNGSYGDESQNVFRTPGYAYISTSANALVAQGANLGHRTNVNLDMGSDVRAKNLKKVEFTLGTPSRNAGVRLFVSGAETTYLEFGFTGGEESVYGPQKDDEGNVLKDQYGNAIAKYKYHPLITKGIVAEPYSGNQFVVNSTTGQTSTTTTARIYNGDAFEVGENTGVAREAATEEQTAAGIIVPATSENSTVTTTGAWGNNVDGKAKITYTIEINDDGTIAWTAVGASGGMSSGVIDDEDVKAMINKSWAYPVAFSTGGDGATNLYDIAIWCDEEAFDAENPYEKKAYTRNELYDMYTAAAYGKKEDVYALMRFDLSSVTETPAEVDWNVTSTISPIGEFMTGAQYEFCDEGDKVLNADGTISDEFTAWARSQAPISSVRFGGGSSLSVNMWKNINGEDSYYVSAPASGVSWNVGDKASSAYSLNLSKAIQALKLNNPNMSFTLCVSPFTTTPEEVGQLVSALTNDTTEAKSYRRSWFGSEAPINVYAIELGNEIEWGISKQEDLDAREVWYQNVAMQMVDAIRAANPNVKIMACGTTAPWGYDPVDEDGNVRNKQWNDALLAKLTKDASGNYVAEKDADGRYVLATSPSDLSLVGSVDIVSFHPYYYGFSPETLMSITDKWFERFSPVNPDIKFSYTEHALDWGGKDSAHTSNLYGALSNGYFVQYSADRAYSDSAYSHNLFGGTLWGRWQYADGFGSNPLGAMYNVLSNGWGDSQYASTITVINEGADTYSTKTTGKFEATAVKSAEDTVNLIFTNNQGYTPVVTNITLPEELAAYKWVGTTTMTAPNMMTHMYDANCKDLAKVVEDTFAEPAAIPATYTVPAKSVVVLTLTTDESKKLKDEFNYAATNPVSSSMDSTGTIITSTEIVASNGTKWITSAANLNTGINPITRTMGTANLNGSSLVVNNVEGAMYKMGANWDVSEYGEIPNITKVEFTTTNSNAKGGVMLFVKTTADAATSMPVETSAFDFSNELCGFDGTVSWVVTIDGDNVSWTATNSGNETKSGTMTGALAAIADYEFLAQVYVNNGNLGSVALDRINVSYGEGETPDVPPVEPKELITYTKDGANITVSVEPSVAGKAFTVIAGYYEGNKLIKVVKHDFAANAEASDFVIEAVPTTAQNIKLMVWDSTNGIQPINGAAIPVN